MTTPKDTQKERRAYHQWVKSGSVFAQTVIDDWKEVQIDKSVKKLKDKLKIHFLNVEV